MLRVMRVEIIMIIIALAIWNFVILKFCNLEILLFSKNNLGSRAYFQAAIEFSQYHKVFFSAHFKEIILKAFFINFLFFSKATKIQKITK